MSWRVSSRMLGWLRGGATIEDTQAEYIAYLEAELDRLASAARNAAEQIGEEAPGGRMPARPGVTAKTCHEGVPRLVRHAHRNMRRSIAAMRKGGNAEALDLLGRARSNIEAAISLHAAALGGR